MTDEILTPNYFLIYQNMYMSPTLKNIIQSYKYY